MIIFTDYNVNLGRYKFMCMYANADLPHNLQIYTRHEKVSISLAFYNKSHGRVVSIPTSYSGGPGFKSRPGDRLS
jgi:hypothetical protein